MHTWYECKIRYQKTAESGKEKKVTEAFLVDALSFTEAESRVIEETKPFVRGEMKVTAIKLAKQGLKGWSVVRQGFSVLR